MQELIVGTIAEYIVCDEINRLGHYNMYMSAVDDPHDCILWGSHTPDKTVEVKLANNGGAYTKHGKLTYFAEIICEYSNGDLGYCEYIAQKVDLIVYYDKLGACMHWYDGHTFCNELAKVQAHMFRATYAKTQGVRFVYDDSNFGYMCTIDVPYSWSYYQNKFYDKALALAQTPKTNRTVYKTAPNFPKIK